MLRLSLVSVHYLSEGRMGEKMGDKEAGSLGVNIITCIYYIGGH